MQFISERINVDLTHNKIKHINLDKAEMMAQLQNSSPGAPNRDVIVRVDNNPLSCDCNLYDFLRYLEGRMHPGVQSMFHIIPGGLKCQGPEWFGDLPVTQLSSKKLKCLLDSSNVSIKCPDRCTCWIRPDDKGLLIDCSYKNLTHIPRRIERFPNHHVELDLTGNFIREIQPVPNSGYDYVTSLNLSHNNISSLSPRVFTSKLKVSMYLNRIFTEKTFSSSFFLLHNSLINL